MIHIYCACAQQDVMLCDIKPSDVTSFTEQWVDPKFFVTFLFHSVTVTCLNILEESVHVRLTGRPHSEGKSLSLDNVRKKSPLNKIIATVDDCVPTGPYLNIENNVPVDLQVRLFLKCLRAISVSFPLEMGNLTNNL